MITIQTYINYICCKRAIRITSQVKWRDHTSILFERNGQLNIFDINKFQIVCFMYKFNINLLPVNFNMFFQTNEQIHHHDTRGKSNIHLISHNTTMRSFSKRIQGLFLWNSLDSLIKQCKSLNSFKNTFNRHLRTFISVLRSQNVGIILIKFYVNHLVFLFFHIITSFCTVHFLYMYLLCAQCIYMRVHVYVFMFRYMCACVCICICVCMCMYAYVYICICVYVCVYIQ